MAPSSSAEHQSSGGESEREWMQREEEKEETGEGEEREPSYGLMLHSSCLMLAVIKAFQCGHVGVSGWVGRW